MNIYHNRLDSFQNSLHKWPHTGKKYHKIESFAKAGFYYVHNKTATDNVCCFLCDIEISDWKQGQSPFTRHKELSPHCAWVTLNFPDVPSRTLSEESIDVLNQPRGSIMRAARLATFNHHNYWPPHINTLTRLPPSIKLSDAGFYYSPLREQPARIRCPYCHAVILHPDKNKNFLQRHRELSTTCTFFKRTHNVRTTRRDTRDSQKSNDAYSTAPEDTEEPKTRKSSVKRKSEDESIDTRNTKHTKADTTSSLDDSIWDIGKAIDNAARLRIKKPLKTYAKKSSLKRPKEYMLPASLTDPSTADIFKETTSSHNKQTTTLTESLVKPNISTHKDDPEKNTPSYSSPSEHVTNDTKKDKGKGKAVDMPLSKKIPLSLSKNKKTDPKEVHESGESRENTPPPVSLSAADYALLQSTPIQFLNREHDLFTDCAFSPIQSRGHSINKDISHSLKTPSTNQNRTKPLIITENGQSSVHKPPPTSPTLPFIPPDILTPEQKKMTVENYIHSLVDESIQTIRHYGEEKIRLIKEEAQQIRRKILSEAANASK